MPEEIKVSREISQAGLEIKTLKLQPLLKTAITAAGVLDDSENLRLFQLDKAMAVFFNKISQKLNQTLSLNNLSKAENPSVAVFSSIQNAVELVISKIQKNITDSQVLINCLLNTEITQDIFNHAENLLTQNLHCLIKTPQFVPVAFTSPSFFVVPTKTW